MKFNQKEWALVLALSAGAVTWFIRVERLLTEMVQQGKYSVERHVWAEKNIEILDKRVDKHDVELYYLLDSKNKPAQGFNAQ